jgi:3-phenylpropionate/trans-cinnamate dioxygenase ferredoxin reductase component
MSSDQTFVIIGAGQAGGWAAKTLRDQGFEGRVIIVGDEDFAPHERPPLSKEVLLGDAEKESCLLWPPGTLEDADIEMRLGVSVKSIDADSYTMSLANGETLAWNKMLIATGGRARSLDVDGVDLDGVYTLRTIEDAEGIRARLTAGAKVLVIGAGWIGLEVAAAARKRDASATVVEVADRVCARALTEDMSQWVHALHERHGVDIRLTTAFSHFAGDGKLQKAVLGDGSEIDCDIAVIGIGLIPNTELAESAGLDIENGIVVDENGQTSHPDIFAAGDVTNHPNALLGRRVRLESWENAQNQAINSAKAMLDIKEPYSEIPWFWSDQYDANIQMMGLPEEWDQTVTRGDRDAGEFIEFYLKDGELQGAAAINNPRDLRFTRRMITSGRKFEADALADPDVKLQKLMKG